MKQSEVVCGLLKAGLSIANGLIYDSNGIDIGGFDGKSITDSSKNRVKLANIRTIYPGMGTIDILSDKDERFSLKCTDEYSIKEEVAYEMPNDLVSVIASMEHLYPDLGKNLFFEQVSFSEMIDMTILGEPEKGIVTLNDKIVIRFMADYQDRLKMMGYIGRKTPGKELFYDAIDYFTSPTGENTRNMFIEWAKSHEWDGEPRVRTWFQRTLGASAPALEDFVGAEDMYIGDATQAWFVGAIARQFAPTKHEIVPVLIGRQGINKGNVLRFTSGRDAWFKDTQDPIDNPKVFSEGIGGRIIVELGEAVQLGGKNSTAAASKVKGFISMTEDQMRLPYARKSVTIPRRYILAATSNEDSVFHDATGNRRFFPMYCDPNKVTFKLDVLDGKGGDWTVSRSKGQYEVEQLWAEAYYMYKHGVNCFITGESKALAEVMQDYGTDVNPEVLQIREFLEDPANGYCAVGAHVTPREIREKVFGIKGYCPVSIQSAIKSWGMEAVLYDWRRLPADVMINGRREGQVFERVQMGGRGQVGKYDILRKFDYVPHDKAEKVGIPAPVREPTFNKEAVEKIKSNPAPKAITSRKQYDAIMTLVESGFIPNDNYVYIPRKMCNGENDINTTKISYGVGYSKGGVKEEAKEEAKEGVFDMSETNPLAVKSMQPKQISVPVKQEAPEGPSHTEVRVEMPEEVHVAPSDDVADIPDIAPIGAVEESIEVGNEPIDKSVLGPEHGESNLKADDLPIQWVREPNTPLIMQMCDFIERMRMAYDLPSGVPLKMPADKVPNILLMAMQTRGMAYIDNGELIVEDVF